MQIIKTTPTNKSFLNKYGKLLSISMSISIFCQLVSSTTETGIFYSNLQSKFEFLGAWKFIPTIFLTIGFVGGLEIGGRALLSYCTDSILYKRFKGLELFLTVLCFTFTILLLVTSLNVSLKGSPTVIEKFDTPPQLESTTSIDEELLVEKKQIINQFSNDSLMIANNYNNQITNFKNEYKGRIEKLQTSIDNYVRKEVRTGKSYTSKKNYLKGKIAELKAGRDNQSGKLEVEKGKELRELLMDRKSDITSATKSNTAEKDKIEKGNNKLITTYESEVETNTGGLKGLVVACLFLFVISVVTERVIYKGAGIKITYHFDDYFFRASPLASWWNYLKEKWYQKSHAKIHQWHSKIPEAILQERPTIIFDRSKNARYIPVTNESFKEAKLIALGSNISYDKEKYRLSSANLKEEKKPLENAARSTRNLEEEILEKLTNARILKEEGKLKEANTVELAAEDVIKTYLGNQATKENINDLKNQIIGFLEGKNENPFGQHHRRKIGFKTEHQNNEKSYVTTELEHTKEFIYLSDKFTVPHQQESGKTIQVGMVYVTGKINTYSNRVKETFQKLDKYKEKGIKQEIQKQEKAYLNRQDKLNYWIEKRLKLIHQIKNAQ